MKVWIAQLKCSNGHTVIALAADVADDHVGWLESIMEAAVAQMFRTGRLKNYCGVCHSTGLQIVSEKIEAEDEETVPVIGEGAVILTEEQRRQLRLGEYAKRLRN